MLVIRALVALVTLPKIHEQELNGLPRLYRYWMRRFRDYLVTRVKTALLLIKDKFFRQLADSVLDQDLVTTRFYELEELMRF